MEIKHIDIENVNMFSDRDRDFYLNQEKVAPFVKYKFEMSEFSSIIAERKKYDTDRVLLHSVLSKQYEGLAKSEATQKNISKLLEDDCFTITTAHQPSLFTGPLYYIYKILSTINLCTELNTMYDEHFVPVFVTGGEDHDFDEINHFYIYGKKIEWQSDEGGSVGRFSLKNIDSVLEELKKIMPDNNHAEAFLSELTNLLSQSKDYGDFSFRLTHLLFDKFGLVILRMDNADFKSKFISIMQDDIFNGSSKKLVEDTQQQLSEIGYSAQAFVRDINVFYRQDGFRKRITKEGDKYLIHESDLSFSKEELLDEFKSHPSRFSPNVVLRPLFQEMILPNLAYIGGGGEIAYWMERKTQFEHYQLPYPMLIRRTSAMIITESSKKQMDKLAYSLDDIFHPVEKLILNHINDSSTVDYKLEAHKIQIEKIFESIQEKIKNIDQTLVSTAKSELAKIYKSLDHLEGKLKKSIKQTEEVQIKRIQKLKNSLFPSGLQERHDNIIEYISMYGLEIIDKMLPHCNPFKKKMLVFIMKPEDRP